MPPALRIRAAYSRGQRTVTQPHEADLPMPRTTLRAGYLEGLLWCKGGCPHQAHADLQKLVDNGRGDVR